MEPRGFEPLTSAVQRRVEGLAVVRRRSEKCLNQPNRRTPSPQVFVVVRLGCRQTVVKQRGFLHVLLLRAEHEAMTLNIMDGLLKSYLLATRPGSSSPVLPKPPR